MSSDDTQSQDTQEQTQDQTQALEQQAQQAVQGISLEPDPQEVAEIDQHVPQAWTQVLEPEPDPNRDEFTPEELQALLTLPVEVPAGNLEALVQEALQGLDLDALMHIDVPQPTQEPTQTQAPDLDLDFGR